MKKIINVFGYILYAASWLAIGWIACCLFGSRAARPLSSSSTEPVAVAVTNVSCSLFNPPQEFVGHVEPLRVVDILPQIDGYLTAILFQEGAVVQEGDVLFEIDPERYTAERKLRLAEIDSAKGQVGIAEAEVARAERYMTRMLGADERGVTRSDIDNAEAALATAKASLAAAKAGVVQAEANLALADFNVKHTRIFAPFTGRIGKALQHEGDYVSSGKAALARIVRTDPIRVTFSIPDRDYIDWCARAGGDDKELCAAHRVRIILPNGNEYAQEGSWDFIANEMSVETATIGLHVLFPNTEGLLVANAYAQVLVDEKNPPLMVTVPNSAIVRQAKGTGVWCVNAQHEAVFRPVQIGRSWRGATEILSGLNEGECVVFQGVNKVIPDCPLRFVSPIESR